MAESGEHGREAEEVAEISGGSGWWFHITRKILYYGKSDWKKMETKQRQRKQWRYLLLGLKRPTLRGLHKTWRRNGTVWGAQCCDTWKSKKEEEDNEIKWPLWEDLNFLRASLQNLDEDNLVWMAEEIGNPFSYSDWIHESNDIYTCKSQHYKCPWFDFVGANATPVIQRTTYRHTYNSAQIWAPNIIFNVFLVYIES